MYVDRGHVAFNMSLKITSYKTFKSCQIREWFQYNITLVPLK